MDRFYPKNFVWWRPQLILLLIFLEVVFHCTGGVAGARGGGGYKDYCVQDSGCQQEFVCDPLRNECTCRYYGTKLTLFYDKELRKCVGAVGKLCTLDDDPELWKIECVPYATCKRPPRAGRSLSDVFGVCTCLPNYEETEEHLCKPAMVIQIGNGDPIFTMAQRRVASQVPIQEAIRSGGNPADNEIVDSDEKGWRKRKPTSMISADTNDRNGDIDVPKPVLDNWKVFDYNASGGTVGVGVGRLEKAFISFVVLRTIVVNLT